MGNRLFIAIVGSPIFVAALGACDVVPATNPFDPQAPPEQQAPASLRGAVVLDDVDASTDLGAELGLVRIGLLDREGRPVAQAGQALVVTPTVSGLNRATFVFDDLAPGDVRLEVQNVDGRFSAPTLAPLTLAPGEDVDVGTITFTARGVEGPGSITGTVNLEGGSGGARQVSLFKRGSTTVLTTTTNASGTFGFTGLQAGDYAVSATLEGFTPDYRTDIPLNGAAGFAATFNGDGTGGEALSLFPVTAVLLPQLERTEGEFYTRDQSVSLAVLAFGGVTGMRLGATACDQAAPACADFVLEGDFVPYNAAAEQALPDDEGRVGIAAQFEVRSSGGFVFVSPPFVATVIRDVTLPVVDNVFVDGGTSPLVVDDDDVTVEIEARDASGVAAIGHVVTAADAPAPAAATVAFEPISTAPGDLRARRLVGLPSVDGSYTVWTFVRDRAGNVSAPFALAVRRDGTPSDSLPIIIDDVAPLEGRSVLLTVSFDGTAAVNLPAEVQVAVGNLPADLVTGRQPFDADASYPLTTTAQDGETLLVQARLFDDVGNVVEVRTTRLVTLRGTLAGIADVEQLGSARDRAGTTVEARAVDGSLLASTTTDAAGAWRLPGLREGRVTLSARRGGHRSFSTDVSFMEADETLTVDTLLPLLRGTIVGRFRRADLETADGRHGDISVNARLISPLRQALGRVTATGQDGDWVLDQVPATLVGERWEVAAAAQGYSGAVVENIAVGDNVITVANPNAVDPDIAEPVLLQPLSGDFVVCSPLDTASDCSALQFTNLSSVRLHLVDDDGVTRLRGAADALPNESTLPLSAYDARNELVVALPDRQGAISLFLDVERDGVREVLGPVEVFRDTVRPRSPVLVMARGAAARRDGFTNEGLVRATATMAIDDADEAARESPLVRAPTFFADVEPAAPLSAGVALCSDGVACTVLLPSLAGVVEERIHDLWSFACDAAGNCSATPAHDRIVFDQTPPSALHGLTFSPTGDRLVQTGPDAFRLGRPVFSVAIEIGEATTASDDVVLDLDGNPVADADAFALSFVAAIDADEATDLPADGDGDGTVFVEGLPLLAGEGDYDIFAVFVDAAGNASAVEPNPFAFALTLDETAPSARLVVADGAAITRSVTIAARLEDLSESGTVKFVGNAADCSSDVDYVASGAAPTTFTLADAEGSQLVVACLRDIVDNDTIATDVVTLDRVAPTGSVELDGGAAFSADRSLVAAFSNVSADVARLKVVLRRSTAPVTSCALDAGYVAFSASAALSIGVAEPSGSFVVDACFEDAAGNKSAVAAIDDIFFDTTAPTATLSINDGAAFTTASEVRVTVGAVDADQPALVFSSMRFANTTPSFSGPGESFAGSRAGLVVASPTVEGTKTICVEVTDELGRTATACDDIALDLTPPAGTLTVSAFATASPVAAVLRSSDVNIASAAAGEGLDCATATFTALARNVDSTVQVGLADTTSEGSRTIVACFKDASGQVARVERTVTFDPNTPALAQAVAPPDGAVLRTRRPTFTWATVPGAVSFTLLVRSGAATVLTQANLTGLNFTPGVDLPQGSLEWIVLATKASGRTSVETFVGAPRVTLDVTAPAAATAVTVAVDGARRLITAPAPCSVAVPCLNDNTPRLSFAIGLDAIDTTLTHVVELADSADPTFGSPVFSQVRVDGSAFDVGVPIADGTYAVRVRSLDDAGNSATSAPVQFVIDRTGPDSPSLLPVRDPVSSALPGNVVIGWTPEGPSGAVAYRFQLTTEALTFAAPLVNVTLDGVLNTSRAVKTDIQNDLQSGAHVVHQVRVAAIDALGNQSPFTVAAFANDTTAPCGGSKSVRILGSDAANDFSDSAAVVTEVSCGSDPGDPFDGPFRMQVGCDGTAAGKPITGFSFVNSCVLPGADGSKTVQAIVFDEAGNPTTAFSDTITLDRAGPTAPVLAIDEVITNDPTFEILIEELSVDPGNNLLRHEFIDGVDVVSFDDPRGVIAGNVVSLTLTEERVYNVRVRGVDKAGNASAEALARVEFDITPPTAPVIANNAQPQVVNADTFTFFLDADASDRHFDHYEVSENGSPFAEIPGDGAFTIGIAANSTTTLALRGVDVAGNVGGSDTITVIEDSVNPQPVALAPMPAFVLGGLPVSRDRFNISGPAAFSTATVDVFLDPAESSNPIDHDANFDHYEVRSSHPSFGGFVPVCLTATRLCTPVVVTDDGTTVAAADVVITDNGLVVGFRVPVVPGQDNTIALRSVDGAGNVSLEGSVTTTDVSLQLMTRTAAVESGVVAFGDTITYMSAAEGALTGSLHLHRPGPDNVYGTDDDQNFGPTTQLALNPAVNRGNFSSLRPIAVASGFVAATVDDGVDADIRLLCQSPTCQLQGGSPIFEAASFVVSDAASLPGVNRGAGSEHLDNAIQRADAEPSISGGTLVWRRQTSGPGSEILVREVGPNDEFDDDDEVTNLSSMVPCLAPGGTGCNDFAPVVSGRHVAFLRCDGFQGDCPATNFRLVVVTADPTRGFVLAVAGAPGFKATGVPAGTAAVMTQAGPIDAVGLALFAPEHEGRGACRTTLAWAAPRGAGGGVMGMSIGPDRTFTTSDRPVRLSRNEGLDSDVKSFSLQDDALFVDDFFAPSGEVVFGGPDGCLSTTADNLAVQLPERTDGASVHDGVVVGVRADPSIDLVRVEFGASRPLWLRTEGTQVASRIFTSAVDMDRDNVVFGSGGGAYDRGNRAMRRRTDLGSIELETSGVRDDLWAHVPSNPGTGGACASDASCDAGFVCVASVCRLSRPVQAFDNVDESFFDPRTDSAVTLSAANRPFIGLGGTDESTRRLAFDGDVLSWQSRSGNQFAGVVRFTGADHLFNGSDLTCDARITADGFAQVRAAGRRALLTDCASEGCSPFTDTDSFVIASQGGVCTTTPMGPGRLTGFDGTRLAAVVGNSPTSVEVRQPGRPTIRFPAVGSINETVDLNGQRVAFIDERGGLRRVVVGDVFDGSTRTLGFGTENVSNMRLEGDHLVWFQPSVASDRIHDVYSAHIGPMPLVAQNERTPAPTRLRCPGDDAFEENDARVTATALGSGGVKGGIICASDVDLYAVPVSPAVGQTTCDIVIELSLVHADGDLEIDLLSPTDAVIGSSTGITDFERITSLNQTTPGTYLVRVRGAGVAEGTYDVGASVTCR